MIGFGLVEYLASIQGSDWKHPKTKKRVLLAFHIHPIDAFG
jgi:hypothetical protein